MGEAKVLADLVLRHLGAEAEFKESTVAVAELGQVRLESLDVFGQCEGRLFGDEAGLLLGAGGLYGPVDGVTLVEAVSA